MKIFITGGTGVIGAPAVRELVRNGHDVRVNARSSDKAAVIKELGAEPVSADVYDVQSLRVAMRGCDAAIRLTTALAGPTTTMRARHALDETNRLRTEHARCMVDAARAEDVGLYVHESFYAVYRDAGRELVTEKSPTDGGDIDAMQAALSGDEITTAFNDGVRRGIVLRFGTFYAAEARSTRDTIAMVEKRMLPQIGPGTFFFPAIHADDAARAVARVLSAPGGIYNVCDDETLTFRDYLTTLADALGAKRPIRLPEFFGPLLIGYPWRWMSRSVRMSNGKLKAATGWSPSVRSVREGWPLVARQLRSRVLTAAI